MNLRKTHIYIIGLLAVTLLLTSACRQQPLLIESTETSIPLSSSRLTADAVMDSMIAPYREQMREQMEEVLCRTEVELLRLKSEPETVLGNFVADLCLELGREMSPEPIDLCLLNFGGLRSSIPIGEVSVEDIYTLMPFDNELVIVTLSPAETDSMLHYLARVGGQPVSALRMRIIGDTHAEVTIGDEAISDRNYHILTSDYLATGGDKMTFLTEGRRSGYSSIGLKVRDAILQKCRAMGRENTPLAPTLDGRIRYE